MANYNLTPNAPRPLSKVFVGARPGSDARWRHVHPIPRRRREAARPQVLSQPRVHEMQQRVR